MLAAPLSGAAARTETVPGGKEYKGAPAKIYGSEEDETWKPLGTGKYRDNFLVAFYALSTFPEIEVQVEESEKYPGRYRLVNPYQNFPDLIGSPGCLEGDHYVYINASDPVHCYVETSPTGYLAGVDQEMIVGSKADDYYNNRYGNWILADEENVCGKLVDGTITFPPMALLATLFDLSAGVPFNPEEDILWQECDKRGMFRLKLPGAPDLDITETQAYTVDNPVTTVTYYLDLQNSIEYAKVALVKGEYNESMVAGVIDGSIPSQQITASSQVSFPYESDGFHTLVVVPYWEGEPRKAYTRTMEFAFDEKEWRKAGRALYTEAILSSNELSGRVFNFKEQTYLVQVEESTEHPGYIRMVNAYGPDYPNSSGYIFDDTRHWYIYINATNPDEVYIEHADQVGLDFNFGKMEIWSRAERYQKDPTWNWTADQVREKGLFGKFINDEITFPAEALCIKFPAVNPNPLGWYIANNNGHFKLKFDKDQINGKQSTGITSVTDDAFGGSTRYYNLDGTEADGSNLTPGLYIVREGNKVTKKIIR